MELFENCVDRATALATACGWLAFGGGLEAAVGVAVGGAGLATAVFGAMRRHGPESEKVLAAIRTRIRDGLEQYASAERWHISTDLESADQAMERALATCFLDRRSLAESARSPQGFPVAATEIIFRKVAECEPSIFGANGSQIVKDYAAAVIRTALEAAIENESYFEKLQPHLMIEALRGIGAIENKVDTISERVASMHSTLLEVAQKFRSSSAIIDVDKIKIELVVNDRDEVIIFYNKEFPYPLDWFEYSISDCRMKIVVAGGFKKEYSKVVPLGIAKFLNPTVSEIILAVLIDDQTGEPIEGNYYPLKFME